ncbi:MAG: class I SAM-dependent methyltransferase [Gammaproteobacteria bacterium]|nr:class I SAM-dependent methyltransferase [Gammaproteobacteria bacterium]
MKALLDLAERGLVPDPLIRFGARRLLGERLRQEHSKDVERASERYAALLDELRVSPVALQTAAANRQHYEVPEAFFRLVLGPRLKYSACYWPEGAQTLADAESAMLELYAQRAELEDGMRILDLGCGWGSFTLWAAARYPNASVLAVSNSTSQGAAIKARARTLGLGNVRVRTADVNSLRIEERFDRVVSIEMFEHVRNYAMLMERIAEWLAPTGELFVHVFCHRHLMYPFETEGEGNWLGRNFFSGGLMPARDTLLHFQESMRIKRRWELSGEHYRKTARAWLENLDSNLEAAIDALAGRGDAFAARRAVQRWRMFFIACEELFGWRRGTEWLVAHYRFGRRG